ncbi:polysaccharide biosynthesis tyrosine autokinase [Rhodococcus kroppenstedtii]|uniref:polysaccharide biosynthesis tyrosine autokinase n=1 Tax=Rhodococcoides kroppenstedtii TaxID=293050 RepID=UPI002955437B|nr:polysaccharide biosynthesis tyrosine autokinase [Rhodococcus kroppenstedtii]MDV7198350.1 polysaccharide biosynthesis tyrosine autokinase [Rhodococcus kroppenstedtii]
MEISDYVRILRARWIVIALTTVVAAAASLVFSLVSTPVYEACTRLYVSTGSSSSSVTEVYQGNLASQQRVASYTQLLGGEAVAARTVDALGLSLTPAQLASKVRTTSSPDTVLIDTCVSDANAVTARDLANGIGTTFVDFVDDLETPPGGGAALAQVSVVEPAQVPAAPISPKTTRNLALGIAVGLLLGIALAVIRDRLDNTVKDRETLAGLSDSPVVGVVPFDKTIKEENALSFAESSSGTAESFRELRTNLQFLEVDSPPRVLVVTSAVPGEGKTTTAVNLALVLAEAGHRVVLVEGDLRRPRVSKYLGLVGSVGLSTVLSGQADVDDVLQPTKFPGVDVLASGPLPPNPSELLGSEASRTVMATLRSRFDYVVVDAPPLLPVTDASVITAHADGALVVARHGHTKREEITRALGNLAQVGAPVLGVILTMTPNKGRKDYEYRHYYETDTSAPRQEAALRPQAPAAVPEPPRTEPAPPPRSEPGPRFRRGTEVPPRTT